MNTHVTRETWLEFLHITAGFTVSDVVLAVGLSPVQQLHLLCSILTPCRTPKQGVCYCPPGYTQGGLGSMKFVDQSPELV